MPPDSRETKVRSPQRNDAEAERAAASARVELSNLEPGLFWLAALVLLALFHFWMPSFVPGPTHDTWSAAAEGKKAYFLLVDRRRGAWRSTELLTRSVPGLAPRGTLLLLGTARAPNPAEWSVLLDWVAGGGGLVIAARTDDPDLEIPGLDMRVSPLPDGALVETADVWSRLDRTEEVLWRTGGEVIAPRARPVIATDTAIQAVVQEHRAGRVVLVASDFLFSNQSLDYGENSVLAFRLLELAGRGREAAFDESLNITGTPKVVGLLLSPVFRPLTVQLLILLILFAWWRSRRFGPVLSRSVPARHNIVDHTDAVGLLTWKTGDGAAALRSYLRQLLVELRLPASATRLHEERILQPIARRLRRDTDAVRKVLARATQFSRVNRLPRRVAAQQIRRLAVIRRAAEIARFRQRTDAKAPAG